MTNQRGAIIEMYTDQMRDTRKYESSVVYNAPNIKFKQLRRIACDAKGRRRMFIL